MDNLEQRLAQLSPEQRALLRRQLQPADEKKSKIPQRDRRQPAPLSFTQQRLWFLEQLNPGSPLYHINSLVEISAPLQVEQVRQALTAIAQRHESLRMTVQVQDGRPMQVIQELSAAPFSFVDLRPQPPEERQPEYQRQMQIVGRQPFDWAHQPLWRSTLFQLDTEEFGLLLTIHHVISDGWSMQVLWNDFSEVYQALLEQRPPVLPELPIQYSDFAQWQQQQSESTKAASHLAYWTEKLGQCEGVLELPSDRPRPATQSFAGRWHWFTVPASVVSGLKTIAQQENASLFMGVLAAFTTLLYRYTRQEDILVGIPIANRPTPETHGLVGFFANTLALRTDLSGNPSFRSLLRQCRKTALEAYRHQACPFEKVVEALRPDRQLNRNPLVQVMLAFQNVMNSTVTVGGRSFSGVQLEIGVSKLDLTLEVWETEGELRGHFEYNTDIFEAATIERLTQQLQVLLAGIVENPDRALAELPLLPPAEAAQLVAWNQTAMDLPIDRFIHDFIAEQSQRTPEAIAVEIEDQTLTYAELNRRANQLAHSLQDLGVQPDTLVGICVERSLEMMVGLLGILKAGGAYVPLDPSYPPERLGFMLEDAHLSIVLTQSGLRDRLPANARTVALDADWDTIAQFSEAEPISALQPDNLIYVLYTSGSTGRPKGAMNTHRALSNLLLWMQTTYQFTAADRTLQKSPLSFDVSVWEVFLPLMVGARLTLARPEGHKDPIYLRQLIQERQITTLQFVPSMLQVFLEFDRPCPSVRRVFCAGEALPSSLQARFFQQFSAELHNLYGPTEAAVYCTFWQCDPQDQRAIVPIGRPLANTQIHILDARLQPVPIGVAGELHIGGVALARGYLNRPELTEEKFIPDPFSDRGSDRLYKTGDLARFLPDGTIEFLGRIDHQVKIRGFRIELGEIAAVLESHPALQAAVVVDQPGAAGEKVLVVYVVANADQSVDLDDLRNLLRSQLPDYMVPATIVPLPSLPLTPNGKLDRRALPRPDLQDSETFVTPRTSQETTLARIWAGVLGLERVGIHNNFFELGGHSLKAAQVATRISNEFSIALPVRCVFEAPTIAELAQTVQALAQDESGERSTQPSGIVRRNASEPAPLSFSQQRLWFLEQLQPQSALYNLPIALRVTGEPDLGALQQALDALVERHEVLRTTYTTIAGQPRQIVQAPQPVDLQVVLLPVPSRLNAALLQVAELPFDLSRDLMLRARVFRAGEDSVLLLVLHHIASDGWSNGILLRELGQLYSGFTTETIVSLPPLPIQYADFAQWQRQWFTDATLADSLSYWRDRLSGPPVLELPVDRPRLTQASGRGDSHAFTLPAEVKTRLQQLGQQEGATLFMVLMAAFQTLLHRYTQQEDILVGTPIAGRTAMETEGLIGFFVNTLVLRTNLEGNPSFRQLLQRVRSGVLEAFAHQDVPFEKLVEVLQPDRTLTQNPLVQVAFVLQSTPTPTLRLEGLTLTPYALQNRAAKFDLTLGLEETDAGLAGLLVYSTDLFEPETIARLVQHYQILLAGIAADPDRPIAQLPLLCPSDVEVIVQHQHTQTEYPRQTPLAQLFEAWAASTPDALAVTDATVSLTYAELNQQANQLAHHLISLGVQPNQLVAVYLERSPRLIVSLLAILKAGGAYLPLDPTYPADRLGFMLEDGQVAVLLSETSQPLQIQPESVQRLDLDRLAATIAQHSSANPPQRNAATDLAYVLYTSGSTGKPKGVMVPHRAIARLVLNTNYIDLQPTDVVAQASNCSFDAATLEIWGALLNGARLTIVPKEVLLSPPDLQKTLRSQQITTLFLTTALFNQLAQTIPDAFAALRYLIFGGEAGDPRSARRILEHGAPQALINGYGPTENTTFSTWFQVESVPDSLTALPIGKPIANTQTFLLDRHLQPVPIGVPGELYLGGDGLALGYLNRPELTAERFISLRLAPNSEPVTLYKTGDRARYLADGNIEFLGRIDQQVKIRGFRIEPGEIERALEQHPQVQVAAVLPKSDRQGNLTLVAYLTPTAPVTVEELRQFLLQTLPSYMVPGVFVLLDSLPLTPNGKLDRKALPDPAWETPAAPGKPTLDPTQTPLERQLVAIWEAVLGVQPIGVQDNFFELGGHSLLAITLLAQIEQTLGKKVSLSTLFYAPTIQQLVQILQQDSLTPVNPVSTTTAQALPLFLIEPSPGELADLARNLKLDRPLYVLETGLFEVTEPHTHIKIWATRSFQQIKAVQPAGPYFLLGYCMGGLVAVEVAQKLRNSGEEVAFLGLVEAQFFRGPDAAFRGGLRSPEQSSRVRTFSYVEKVLTLRRHLTNLKKLKFTQKFAYIWQHIRYLVQAIIDRLPRTVAPEEKLRRAAVKLGKQAVWRYTPEQVYDAPVQFFLAEINSDSKDLVESNQERSTRLGYHHIVPGEARINLVSGDHWTLVREPNVQALCKLIERELDRIENKLQTR